MKRIFPILIISLLAIAACDNDKAAKKEPMKTGTSLEAEEKKKAAAANEKMLDELQKLVPLSEEELKKMMPESLMEATLTDYNASSSLGASLATGEYKINDSTSISLNIYDCAGPGGAGLYNLQFAGLLDYTTDNPAEYTKVIDFNGGKAIEHCMKASVECSFTFFSGSRFLVALEGKNVGAEELKKIANSMHIK